MDKPLIRYNQSAGYTDSLTLKRLWGGGDYKIVIFRKISPLTYPEKFWLFLKHSKEKNISNQKLPGKKKVYILAKYVNTDRLFAIKAKKKSAWKRPISSQLWTSNFRWYLII